MLQIFVSLNPYLNPIIVITTARSTASEQEPLHRHAVNSTPDSTKVSLHLLLITILVAHHRKQLGQRDPGIPLTIKRSEIKISDYQQLETLAGFD